MTNNSTSVWHSGRLAAVLVFLFYLAVTLPAITRYPAPWVDEGWIGEVAAQIAHGHAPGNPSHGTLYRYNDRLYWMPPLYFYLLGGWFSLAGVTLIAGRLFNLVVGALTTALLFDFARRRWGALAGTISALVLLLDTFAWKAHRTIRFESLLALLAVLLARFLFDALRREGSAPDRRSSTAAWAGAGGAAGLLLNTHPLGSLFIAAAFVEMLRSGGLAILRRKGPWVMALVVVVTIVPYAIYCLADSRYGFRNFLGQNSFHMDVGHGQGPVWFREWRRYAAFLPWPWRIPAAAAFVTVVVAAIRRRREPAAAFCLTFLIVPLLGMVFLPNKTLLYLVPVLPFAAALAGAAWSNGAAAATGAAAGRPRGLTGIARIAALLLVVSGLAIDGGLLWKNRDCDPVRVFNEISARLRPGDRVAGTFVTWWAVQPRPFHEFSRGATLEAVDAFRPDVIILGDRQWEQEKAGRFGPLDRALSGRFEAEGVPEESIPDPCLGTITLHRVKNLP